MSSLEKTHPVREGLNVAQNVTDGNNSGYAWSEEETKVFVDLVYKKKTIL